jgi:hypothetical protein
MGQPLGEQQRAALKQHPSVLRVTAQHLVLKDGRVLDPNEFWGWHVPIFLVMKLTACRCARGHHVGKHVIVEGSIESTVLAPESPRHRRGAARLPGRDVAGRREDQRAGCEQVRPVGQEGPQALGGP